MDCPYEKACINDQCVDPCINGRVYCGLNAICQTQNHEAICECPLGTQGNPFVSCVSGHCQYNEDCADHEACDRLNRACRPVCDEETCALDAVCLPRNHQPQCECKAGLVGNPHQQCLPPEQTITIQSSKPSCLHDSECPSQLACINQRCSNPCALAQVCSSQQTCTVLDILPLRTMICKCPKDTFTDNAGNCVALRQHEIYAGCQNNNDCANNELCQRGSCLDACQLERCGLNAQCLSRDHYSQCSCPKGFEGNPRVECLFKRIQDTTTLKPSVECSIDDDCRNDRTCQQQRCVNPCQMESCGIGAYCHTQLHRAICRCPPGYLGDPQTRCSPRKYNNKIKMLSLMK